MAGGEGTRFWPWSVKSKPKQFLSLVDEETMLQLTYNRFRKWLPQEKIFIVTTQEYVPLVKEQVEIDDRHIFIEPLRRDTAPCIALTASQFLRNGNDEPFAAVPADHYISNSDALPELFMLAEKIAKRDGSIVTFGIQPDRPETGYGYIHVKSDWKIDNRALSVKSFIEKPNSNYAEALLQRGDVYWNSGMFVWKPSTIAYYMKKYQPQIWKAFENRQMVSAEEYALLPKLSIDYAILEKAKNISMIPASFKWDDIGSWSALDRLNKKSQEENLIYGNIKLFDTNNCIIKSDKNKTIVIGVEDLIISSTEEGLLICHKSQEQRIKEVLKRDSASEK
jgi:mannose-1-phosphate guanylyltransferase